MLEYFFEILPSMFLIIFSMVFMLIAVKPKYPILKTSLILSPVLLVLIAANILIFSPLGIDKFDDWSLLTVFIPEAIMATLLGKRKGVSKFSAIINSYAAFYIIVLLKNVSHVYFDSLILEYCIYAFFVPFIYIYIVKFYNHLHDNIEKLTPKFLNILTLYSLFIFFEFYLYRSMIQGVNIHILRLEIFGIAIISVYIVSIFIFDIILRHYISSFEQAKDKEKVEMQMKLVLNQFKIRDEKDKQLKIIRHDMKHAFAITSRLINEGNYQKAIEFINQQIEVIDSTKLKEYCKDTILNAVICYYEEKCLQNNINLNIKIDNIEQSLKIDTSEVAMVLANCFENAINASMKLKENKEINFKFVSNKGSLIMQMNNYHDSKIIMDKNNTPKSLIENHGFGTKSIKSFTNKYNLFLDYDVTDTQFTISIIFN